MSINRDKSEIAESFKHLLQKADEMALDNKKDDLIEGFNLEKNDKYLLKLIVIKAKFCLRIDWELVI